MNDGIAAIILAGFGFISGYLLGKHDERELLARLRRDAEKRLTRHQAAMRKAFRAKGLDDKGIYDDGWQEGEYPEQTTAAEDGA